MILQIDLPTIQAGTILIAAATFFGALVGSLIQFYLQQREDQKTKRNLRVAFLAELKAAEVHTTLEIRSFEHMEFLISSIPDSIFRANTDNIGGLKQDEVEALVEYYSLSHGVEKKLDFDKTEIDEYREKLSEIEGAIEEGIYSEEKAEEIEEFLNEDPIENDVKESLESYLSTLDKRREEAIQALESNLSH